MSTVPVPAGATTEIDVSLETVGVSEVVPNVTEVAPVNPVPVMVTVLPPPGAPLDGLIEVMIGPPP